MRSASLPTLGHDCSFAGQVSHSEWDEFFESAGSPLLTDHRTRRSVLSRCSFGISPAQTENLGGCPSSVLLPPENHTVRSKSAAELFITNFDSKKSSGSF